jgi:hypothetical protein
MILDNCLHDWAIIWSWNLCDDEGLLRDLRGSQFIDGHYVPDFIWLGNIGYQISSSINFPNDWDYKGIKWVKSVKGNSKLLSSAAIIDCCINVISYGPVRGQPNNFQVELSSCARGWVDHIVIDNLRANCAVCV